MTSEKQNVNFTNKKNFYALQKFILAKIEGAEGLPVEKAQIKSFIDYIQSISGEYTAFRAEEDNMILFGGDLELMDIKRAVCRQNESIKRDAA